jgi:hypothetical protein
MSSIRKMWKDSQIKSRVNAQVELEKLEKEQQHYTESEYIRLREKWIKIIEDSI